MICAPRQTILLCVAALAFNAAASEAQGISGTPPTGDFFGNLPLYAGKKEQTPLRNIAGYGVSELFRIFPGESQGWKAASAKLKEGDYAAFAEIMRQTASDPADPGRFAARIFSAESAFVKQNYFVSFNGYLAIANDRSAPEELRLKGFMGALDSLVRGAACREALEILRKAAAAFPEQQSLWDRVEIFLLGGDEAFRELEKKWNACGKNYPPAPDALLYDGLVKGGDAAVKNEQWDLAAEFYAGAFNFAGDDTERGNCLKKLIPLQEKKNPEQALRSVERFLRYFPDSADSGTMKLHKGALLSRLKKVPEALKIYRELLNDPGYKIDDRIHAAFQAAQVSEQNGDFSTAREFYNSAGRRFGGNEKYANRIKMQLLEFLVRTGEFSAAAVVGEELAGIKGVDGKRLNLLRLKALSELKRYADAAEIATLLAGSGDSLYAAEGAWQLARLTELQKDPRKARELYLDFSKKFPGEKRAPEAGLAAADISIKLKDFQNAAALFEDYLKKFPDHPQRKKAMSVAVIVLLHQDAQGDREKAGKLISEMQKHFGTSPEYDRAAVEMVRYLCKNEEYTSALERIRNFLRDRTESPLYPEALMLAATVFDRSGNHEQTMEYVDRLLDKYPNSPLAVESAMLGGSSCFRQGNYGRALKYYERACELGGRGVVAQVAAGEAADCHLLLRTKNDLESAIRIYSDLARRSAFPALQVQALYKLGLAFEYSGNELKALKAYDDLLTLAVNSPRIRQSSGAALWCVRAARSALKILMGNSQIPDGSQKAQRIWHLYSRLGLPDTDSELKRNLEEIIQHYNLLER